MSYDDLQPHFDHAAAISDRWAREDWDKGLRDLNDEVAREAHEEARDPFCNDTLHNCTGAGICTEDSAPCPDDEYEKHEESRLQLAEVDND